MQRNDGQTIVEQCTAAIVSSCHLGPDIRARLGESSGRVAPVAVEPIKPKTSTTMRTTAAAPTTAPAPASATTMTHFDYDDPVHGRQRLPAIVGKIIATRQFQRLRQIHQLGVCNFVFPSATHTRYEHSLGVCVLVIRYLDILDKKSGGVPSNADADFFKLCVILAGLLHDIGHGPFSHMWESFVHCGNDTTWAHEDTSCDVVEHLFATNEHIRISPDPPKHATGVALIVALIRGDVEGEIVRTVLQSEYHYLAEVVNNKYCLIDVDKWDYMLRDMHHLNVTAHYDCSFVECFERASVVRPKDGGRTHIAFHEDTLDAVRAVFGTRAQLHANFYKNPRVIEVEMLIRQAFRVAESCGYVFNGVKLTECHRKRNLDVYNVLNDTILNEIEQSADTRLERAQHLLRLWHDRSYTAEYNEHTRILQLMFHNNNDVDERHDTATLTCEVRLPDPITSLPSTVALYKDDGQFFERNPRGDN